MKITKTGFVRYAWFVVGYNILVILWGALVRATGSGAGCGSHWPTCNGEVIPLEPSTATMIEFTHRLTSGIAFLTAVALVWGAFRLFRTDTDRDRLVRKASVYAMVFMVIEALVGAALVLLELVADNQSVGRAVILGFHLMNTLFLLASLVLTAWWASAESDPTVPRIQGSYRLLLIGLGAFILLGATGAITALGDTLFPSDTLSQGIAEDFSPTAHFLIRLRVWHPILALVIAVFLLIIIAPHLKAPTGAISKRAAQLVAALLVLQLSLGFINLLLLAPTWMQLVHLLGSDLLWIALVLLTAASHPEYGKLIPHNSRRLIVEH